MQGWTTSHVHHNVVIFGFENSITCTHLKRTGRILLNEVVLKKSKINICKNSFLIRRQMRLFPGIILALWYKKNNSTIKTSLSFLDWQTPLTLILAHCLLLTAEILAAVFCEIAAFLYLIFSLLMQINEMVQSSADEESGAPLTEEAFRLRQLLQRVAMAVQTEKRRTLQPRAASEWQ